MVCLRACSRLREACILLLVLSVIIALLMYPSSAVVGDAQGLGVLGLSVAALMASGGYARCRGMMRLADASQTTGLALMFGLIGGALAMLSARSGMPLVDSTLRAADAGLFLSAPSFVKILSVSPPVAIATMQLIYQSSFPLLFGSLVLLALTGSSDRGWRMCFLFGLSLIGCSLISYFMPAYGNYAFLHSSEISGMPPLAGRYFWSALDSFRNAERVVLSIDSLSGVVTFPSFHAVMALLVAQAWWSNPLCRWPVAAWNGLIAITAIPMGGHYFVDLLAGAGVWAASVAVVSVIEGYPQLRESILLWRRLDGPRRDRNIARIRT